MNQLAQPVTQDDDFAAAMQDAMNFIEGSSNDAGAPPPSSASPAPAADAAGATPSSPTPPASEASLPSGSPTPSPDGLSTQAEQGASPAPADPSTPDAAPLVPPASEPAGEAADLSTPPPPSGVDPAVQAAIAAAVAAARPPEPAAPATPPPPPPEPEKPLTLDQFLTDDDRKVLAEYEKEWGEVSRAEQVRRRAEMQLQQAFIFREVGKALAPIVAAVKQSQVDAHFNAIRSAHPDYEQLVPKLGEWIGKQPDLYRSTLDRVLKGGSTAEVIQLISAYKQAVGQPSAVPATPASPAPKAPTVQVATPASVQTPGTTVTPPSAAAVAATAAVTSQRGGTVLTADPNDYDSAFREALGSFS